MSRAQRVGWATLLGIALTAAGMFMAGANGWFATKTELREVQGRVTTLEKQQTSTESMLHEIRTDVKALLRKK